MCISAQLLCDNGLEVGETGECRLTMNNKGGMCNIQRPRVRHAMDKCFVEARRLGV